MRSVHGPRRRQGRALLRHARRGRGGHEDHDPRRSRIANQAAPVAAGLHRRAGSAVRLLHRGHVDVGQGAARRDPASQRGRDPAGARGQPLPLRDAQPDRPCDPAGSEGDVAMSAVNRGITRRRFLGQTAALTVGFTLAPLVRGLAQAPSPLPGSLQKNRMLDGWLRINPDGTVTAFTGKVEIGQGIVTALAQIVGDELEVDLARIEMVSGDTSRTPDEGVTSGSRSIEESGSALRFASAEARGILLETAAANVGAPVSSLRVEDGTILAPGGARATYWELTTDAMLKRESTAKPRPRPASEHRFIGKSVPRRDIPGKVTGGAAYVHDMRLPGMLFARVVRPPSPRARLISLD